MVEKSKMFVGRKGDTCPLCKGLLAFMGEFHEQPDRNRIDRKYKCLRCKAIVGVPTEWGLCDLRGLVWRDKCVGHQCDIEYHCPYWKNDTTYQCPHFVKQLDHSEVEVVKGKTGKQTVRLIQR